MHVYQQPVTQALEHLAGGLGAYVEMRLRAIYHGRWREIAAGSFRNVRSRSGDAETPDWDAHATLTVMWDQWNSVFRHDLSPTDRSLVNELREFRNRWAHQAEFDFDDAYRVLDSAQRLLTSIGSDKAAVVAEAKRAMFQAEFERQARSAYQKARARRKNMQDILVYVCCCTAMVFVILQNYGARAWFMVAFVIVTFGFIIWQRLSTPPAVHFGPHECIDCGRIVYSDVCPYCDPAPRPLPEEPAVPETKAVETRPSQPDATTPSA